MNEFDEIITDMIVERDKYLTDLQHMVMTCAAWGVKKVDIDVTAAALMMKLTEKLLRSQISLDNAQRQQSVIDSVRNPSFSGYGIPEKSETAEAISLELKEKFISGFSREQPKESPAQYQETPVDC
ncbi:hypothetical protein [Xenorhabdus hominickii]|uniref:Uncharacterized protein n=1 Tax=Xenorhabdus hominickii TaxID=351679 RepID=A0A2G0PQR6_XENHO|nr:hypothetical protein [Xenorhabdus hominickii]AOM40190.1 hypothetical protein A9255_06105 [Xenorhabdus hominickii]PHM49328.1 hypothetical protein Xhom_05013 [Xenorhabdus hominickii]